MGIRQYRDGNYYITCDFDGCGNEVKLQGKSFWEASDEAKRLGWITRKTQYGWVNFDTAFCAECYFCPKIKVRRKKKSS